VVWVPEAYGADAVSILGHLSACTRRIALGAGVMQIPARTPAATAMATVSLDSLSGGRFRLGLGVSGPQVSEGWHGVPFGKPLARTRDYVQVVRAALSGRPLRHDGEFFTLPQGAGPPLRLTHAHRATVPIYLAAVGPRNLELAGRIADGWLGVFAAPGHLDEQLAGIRKGRAQREDTPTEPFRCDVTAALAVGDDLEACVRTVSPYPALYVGGMGSREQNFYNQLAVRMGYEQEAARVQELYLARRWAEAAQALPPQFVDDTSLLGDLGRITARMRRYRDAGIDTLTVAPWGADLDQRMSALETAVEAHRQLGEQG
jgi:F420-dependent oxidoreductase-like protein